MAEKGSGTPFEHLEHGTSGQNMPNTQFKAGLLFNQKNWISPETKKDWIKGRPVDALGSIHQNRSHAWTRLAWWTRLDASSKPVKLPSWLKREIGSVLDVSKTMPRQIEPGFAETAPSQVPSQVANQLPVLVEMWSKGSSNCVNM